MNYLNQKVDTQIKCILKVNIPLDEIKNVTRFKNVDKYHSIDEEDAGDSNFNGKNINLFFLEFFIN